MPRRPRLGRPRNPVPSVQLGIRVAKPVWKRVVAEAERQGMRPGEFVQELLDRAVPAQEAKSHE